MKINFGKYFGMELHSVPTTWLRENWDKIVRINTSRKPELVSAAEREMKKRERNEVRALRINAKKLKRRKARNRIAKKSRARNRR